MFLKKRSRKRDAFFIDIKSAIKKSKVFPDNNPTPLI